MKDYEVGNPEVLELMDATQSTRSFREFIKRNTSIV